jgi:hypothetical protein
MASILETKEPVQPTKSPGGPNLLLILGLIGLVILLGASIAQFMQLRSAKADLQAKVQTVTDQVANLEKRVGEVDLAVAGVKARTEAVAERVGMTEVELDKSEPSRARSARTSARASPLSAGRSARSRRTSRAAAPPSRKPRRNCSAPSVTWASRAA